jgi:hypothetical protein
MKKVAAISVVCRDTNLTFSCKASKIIWSIHIISTTISSIFSISKRKINDHIQDSKNLLITVWIKQMIDGSH